MTGLRFVTAAVALTIVAADNIAAQTPPQPAQSTAPELSGILFGSFNYRTDAAQRAANRFDLDRVYITVRAPAGDRTSLRLTADVFQQLTSPNDAYYRGWTVRMKYAYLQHQYLRTPSWSALARIGMLHTVVIENEEMHWPRWMGTVGLERFGFFSSADVGAATQLTLPNRRGEVYATIANGPGYTSREVDRFKDYSARLTLTPFAKRTTGILRTLQISPWAYRGAIASQFVASGTGQIGPVAEGLRRDRMGLLVGVRDPSFTLAMQYAHRMDEGESGSNTPTSPRSVRDTTGRLISVHGTVRPFARVDSSFAPLAFIGRWDAFTPNTDTDPAQRFIVAGLIWDLSRRASVALDYQRLQPRSGSAVREVATVFLHFVATY